MSDLKYSVSFRIQHPSMKCDDMSTALALAPDSGWSAGDARVSPKGRPLGGTHDRSYWSHELARPDQQSLAECLEAFTTRLEPHRQFLNDLRSSGGRCEFFIGWFADRGSGELLGHNLLGKLSALGVDLALDVYGTK